MLPNTHVIVSSGPEGIMGALRRLEFGEVCGVINGIPKRSRTGAWSCGVMPFEQGFWADLVKIYPWSIRRFVTAVTPKGYVVIVTPGFAGELDVSVRYNDCSKDRWVTMTSDLIVDSIEPNESRTLANVGGIYFHDSNDNNEHGGTVSYEPNFAYRQALGLVDWPVGVYPKAAAMFPRPDGDICTAIIPRWRPEYAWAWACSGVPQQSEWPPLSTPAIAQAF